MPFAGAARTAIELRVVVGHASVGAQVVAGDREVTVLPGEPSYDGLTKSLINQSIEYTIEFFPEEGKYHYTGHRKCSIRYSPGETTGDSQRCPRCGGRLTLGVMHRVEELASRNVQTWTDEKGFTRAENGRPPFKTLVALIDEGLCPACPAIRP